MKVRIPIKNVNMKILLLTIVKLMYLFGYFRKVSSKDESESRDRDDLDTCVRGSDISDPVLASHISEAGPGWSLSPPSLQCQDYHERTWSETDMNCEDLATKSNNCTGSDDVIISMLAHCRATCREIYKGIDFDDLPEGIQRFGGVGDYIQDEFGFRLGVCNFAEGFVANQRVRAMDFQNQIEYQKPMIPAFTKQGFLHIKMPPDLYNDILDLRRKSLKEGKIEIEHYIPGTINHQVTLVNEEEQMSMLKSVNRTSLIVMDDEIREKIFKTLGPLAEEWSGGVKLIPTSIYGIRRYVNNSWLISHLDRPTSHVISVIMNIAQEVEEEWPLFIKDHEDKSHVLVLKPGDMVWYESAKLLHGRQKPFQGSYYDNVFIHYKPVGRWYGTDDQENWKNGKVEPITIEEVKHSQRNMANTDWDQAWIRFQEFTENSKVDQMGIKGITIGGNDVEW